jgi:hypothetical protein
MVGLSRPSTLNMDARKIVEEIASVQIEDETSFDVF